MTTKVTITLHERVIYSGISTRLLISKHGVTELETENS